MLFAIILFIKGGGKNAMQFCNRESVGFEVLISSSLSRFIYRCYVFYFFFCFFVFFETRIFLIYFWNKNKPIYILFIIASFTPVYNYRTIAIFVYKERLSQQRNKESHARSRRNHSIFLMGRGVSKNLIVQKYAPRS